MSLFDDIFGEDTMEILEMTDEIDKEDCVEDCNDDCNCTDSSPG
jgi:hypothetical protein